MRLRSSASCPVLAIVVLLVFAGRCPGADAPATTFENQCAACHGLDGKAHTPAGRKAGAKDLSESKLTDAEITRQIREGSKDKRRATKMPAFAEKLTAEEISSLVTYVKSFRPH